MLALWIVAGILLLVVLVLSVPVDLTFDVTADGDGRRRLRVGWLFGLVGKDLLPRKKKGPRKAKKPEKVKEEKKARKRKKPDLGLLISVLRTRGLLAGVIRLLRRMLRSLHFRELDADLRVGLPDPADTGVMYGALWSVFAFRSASGPVRFRMEPAFEGAAFEGSARGAVRVFPAQMAANAACFVVSPAGLRVIRLTVVSWWRKKRK